jgi:apolipoprotein N-acyltransferase
MRDISPATGIVFCVIVMMALFTFYQWVQHLTQNRLNKFSLIILLIGIEYLLLKLSLGDWVTFLADAIQEQTDWIRWNIYTGYLGSSAWILLVNLLVYQAFFKDKGINWVLVVVAALITLLPVLYSYDLTNNALTKEQVVRFYKGDESKLTQPYLSHGELISRTGAWLSILIIIFTFVRAKTKKVAR